jgi:uncharacterized protein YjbJ (UPF0337 family)
MGKIIDKTKGKLKRVAGELTGDDKLVREGKKDEIKGKAKGAVAGIKDAAKDIKHAIKKAAK